MTELVLKGKIDQKKLDSIVNFLRSWDIDVEVRESNTEQNKEKNLFTESFGMWADRDVDIKAMRQKTRERRTKVHGNDSL
ncbi:MAG: hypothetical protein WC914_01815 [Proteiniphilum sp.]|jgi:hypothetical protein